MKNKRWNALKALYTPSSLEGQLFPKVPSKIAVESEHKAQVKFVEWLRWKDILFFSVPNGADVSSHQRAVLVAEGLSSGVPDLVIPIPVKPYHGLFIELKREIGGVVSEKQKWWLETLNDFGYLAVVAKGYDAAVKITEDYLNGVHYVL